MLAQLPDEPVDAIGFSLGARVLLTIASDHPERFSRLVLTGVGANLLRTRGQRPHPAGDRGRGRSRQPGRAVLRRARPAPRGRPRGAGRLPALAAPALTPERLAAVDLPVLVVLGDKDFAGPGEPLVEALPQAELVTLRNVDHFATPKDFGCIDAALDFLGAAP